MMKTTNQHKKVVLVGPSLPYRGGISHFTEQMARALREGGHEVRLVTFRRQYPRWLFPGKTQFAESSADGGHPATKLIDTLNPISWWRTARFITALAPDGVLFQHWMPFFAPAHGTIARLLRRNDISSYCVVHNALPHERHIGDQWLNRYLFDACRGFLVMSESVKRDLRAIGVRGPIRTTAHPVYDRFGSSVDRATARRRLGLSQDAPVLLFFGFIRRYKGLETLLEAMPAVRARYPDVRLVIAGEFYDDEEPYMTLIRELDLGTHIWLVPRYIPDDMVSAFFGAADLVVQPYARATQSGVAQIASHFERPMIVTDVGGLPEAVPHEEAGLIVPPENPAALASAITRFLDEDLAEELAEGIRREKLKHGADHLVGAVESLIERPWGDHLGCRRT